MLNKAILIRKKANDAPVPETFVSRVLVTVDDSGDVVGFVSGSIGSSVVIEGEDVLNGLMFLSSSGSVAFLRIDVSFVRIVNETNGKEFTALKGEYSENFGGYVFLGLNVNVFDGIGDGQQCVVSVYV